MSETTGFFIPLIVYAFVALVAVIIIAVLIIKRVQEKDNEKFEKRDY